MKNERSVVTPSKSITHIENVLIKNGASLINKMIENGRVTGIAFVINLNGTDIPFKIPVRIDNVANVLKKDRKRLNSTALKNIYDQAERTAWKLLSDWVDIQCSLIELQQVKLMEVFLPYIYNQKTKQTFFDQIEGDGSLLQIAFKD